MEKGPRSRHTSWAKESFPINSTCTFAKAFARWLTQYLSSADNPANLIPEFGGGAGISLHTLRHTFASRLVMSGADLRTVMTVMEVGGWGDLSLVQRYSHRSPGHCQQAIERIVEEFPAKFPPMPETGAVVQLAERRVSM